MCFVQACTGYLALHRGQDLTMEAATSATPSLLLPRPALPSPACLERAHCQHGTNHIEDITQKT